MSFTFEGTCCITAIECMQSKGCRYIFMGIALCCFRDVDQATMVAKYLMLHISNSRDSQLTFVKEDLRTNGHDKKESCKHAILWHKQLFLAATWQYSRKFAKKKCPAFLPLFEIEWTRYFGVEFTNLDHNDPPNNLWPFTKGFLHW